MKSKRYERISTFINWNFKKCEKIVALRKEYKQINNLKIDTGTDCLGNEITLNKNIQYKYLRKIIFL